MRKFRALAIAIVFAVASISLGGCGKGGSSQSGNELTPISHTRVLTEFGSPDAAPKEVWDWVQANMKTKYAAAKSVKDTTFILIAAGPQPSSGYDIAVTSVVESAGQVRVVYKVVAPPPGTGAATVISYPYVLLKVPYSKTYKTFSFTQDK